PRSHREDGHAVIDWSTIECAVIAWVEGAGVTAILSGHGGPRPPRPFVSVRLELGGVEGLDSVEGSDADSPEPGAEIVKTHRGNRVLTISMQSFSADAAGSESAGAILSTVASRASLDTVRDALNAAGIGISAI